jgi:hypothetical protein
MPTLYGFRGEENRIYAGVNTHLFKRGAFLAGVQWRKEIYLVPSLLPLPSNFVLQNLKFCSLLLKGTKAVR